MTVRKIITTILQALAIGVILGVCVAAVLLSGGVVP